MRTVCLLALLTLFAFWLRLRGIGYGLPLEIEGDCMTPHQVEVLRDPEVAPAERIRERNFNWYPLLLARLVALWPEVECPPTDASLELHLAAASRAHVQSRTHPSGTLLIAGFRSAGERVARISPDGRDDYSEHPSTTRRRPA